jgi:hypothetical protein
VFFISATAWWLRAIVAAFVHVWALLGTATFRTWAAMHHRWWTLAMNVWAAWTRASLHVLIRAASHHRTTGLLRALAKA